MNTAAVVLAAGAATRYGGPKQRVLLPSVLAALERSSVGEIVVVEGAYPLAVDGHGRRSCTATGWELGPGASLRCGLAALGDEVAHALIVLADGPTLDPRAVERVLGARRATRRSWRRPTTARAAIRSCSRARPGPTIPDEGGRALAPTLVDCSDLNPPGDVDYR